MKACRHMMLIMKRRLGHSLLKALLKVFAQCIYFAQSKCSKFWSAGNHKFQICVSHFVTICVIYKVWFKNYHWANSLACNDYMNYLVIVFLRSNKHEIETISYVRKISERRYWDRKFRKNVKRQKWQVKYFYYCYDYYEFLNKSVYFRHLARRGE